MGRRRPTDWIDWLLYRRAWLPACAALVLVLITSFQPDPAVMPAQPPGFTAADAQSILHAADTINSKYPDRRPGTSGAADSAQWVRDQLRIIRDQFQGRTISADVVTDTTTIPGRPHAVSIMNVEALLPGRTDELVVVYAPRDTAGRSGRSGDAGSTAALISIAQQLAASPDRKRSYLLVSTDAARANGAGARLMATRIIQRAQQPVAVIGLDGIGQSHEVRIPLTSSGGMMPPLGLVLAARAAGGASTSALPGTIGQMLRLGLPLTRYEHGQVLREHLPAITISTAAPGDGTHATEDNVIAGMYAVLGVLGSLDATDTLQSAGKTYVLGADRVMRGWALKILIVSLLLPVWLVVARALVTHRRRLGLVPSLGSIARGMLVGIWGIATLWLFAIIGVIPHSSDVPPASSLVGGWPTLGMIAWALLMIPAWLIGRGPDWRRAQEANAARATTLAGLTVLVVLSVCALALNPYSVLFGLPTLHAWLWLVSRHAHGRRAQAIVAAGLLGPLLALVVVHVNLHVPVLRLPVYGLDLLATRSVPAALGLIVGMSVGCAAMMLVAMAGRIGAPTLTQLRYVRRANQRHALRRNMREIPSLDLPLRPTRATMQTRSPIRRDVKSR